MVDPISLGVTALGFAGGFAGQSKYVDAYRNQRRRVGKTLQLGKAQYGIQADQAIQAYMQAIGRLQEGTQSALAETANLGQAGYNDLSANLDRQLAQNRSGMGSVLAQSSLAPAFNRGAYSDFRRDLSSLQEAVSRQRAGIHLQGASQEANATQMLADALFRRGSAEFTMQQALAERFGNSVSPPSPIDFGGLAALGGLFQGGGSTGGGASGGIGGYDTGGYP